VRLFRPPAPGNLTKAALCSLSLGFRVSLSEKLKDFSDNELKSREDINLLSSSGNINEVTVREISHKFSLRRQSEQGERAKSTRSS
jgi:hypothetical protein